MKGSAFPLVGDRYGRVQRCRIASRSKLPAKEDRRGGATPRHPPYITRVGYLTTSNGREPTPADASETPLRASPGTALTGPSRATRRLEER